MNYPLVTIGLPTFNRADSFEKTLRSAIAQDYPNLEIVISDNASTDGTEQICNQLRKEREGVTYVRQEKNLGASNNFMTVLHHARGEYFMWLGDDDWLDANYISSCVAHFLKDTGASIVGGLPKYYIGDRYIYSGITMNFTDDSASKRLRNYFRQVKHNGIFYGLMRTDAVRSKPFRKVLGDDLLFVASFVFSGRIYTLDQCSVHRRRGGISSQNKALVKSMGLSWMDAYLPRLSAANNVFDYIVTDSSFAGVPKIQRYILALECVALATFRKVASVICPRCFTEQSYRAPKE